MHAGNSVALKNVLKSGRANSAQADAAGLGVGTSLCTETSLELRGLTGMEVRSLAIRQGRSLE
jgi:hypothetical protein